MKLKFDVTTQELTIVQQVLQNALPHGCKVWLFGSRAKHQAKFNSDLDLAIECKLPLDKATLRQLNEGFDESRLPYSVDVIDMHKVSADFKKTIDQKKVEFPLKENVPALRFSEFSSTGWSQIRLSQLARVIDCKHRTPPYVEDGVAVISPGSIVWGELNLDSLTKRVSEEEYQSLMDHCSPKMGDLVFSRNQSLGVASYVLNKHKFVLGQDTVLIQSENDSFFIYFNLQSSKAKNQIVRLSGGSTFSRINLKDIRELVISCPNDAEEQQKIAAFLGSVDEKLGKLRRKRELLETWKRGLMQKIFSQEIRFARDDGTVFLDWEEKKLGELADRQTTKNTNNNCGRVLTNSAIRGVLDQRDYFDKDIANSDNLQGYYIIEKGDYVYNPRISVSAPVGPINKNGLGQGVMSPLYSIFRFRDENSDYYEQYFQTKFWHRYMCSVANYGARFDRMNITTSDFMDMSLPYPHPDEQAKIVDYLNSVDKKIEAVAGQIAAVESFKKGLLQKMFV